MLYSRHSCCNYELTVVGMPSQSPPPPKREGRQDGSVFVMKVWWPEFDAWNQYKD